MEEKAKIIYQDDYLMILNKNEGVVCTKEGRIRNDTLEDWIVDKFGDNNLPRKGIVHRLDKGTSGLMIVVKTIEARESILKMFKKREIKKTYIALIEGDLPIDGVIKVPIARSNYVFGKFAVFEDGKEAETHFRLIRKYEHLGKKYSLVEIDLKTGRTHQIRVHFSYLHWPLTGDLIYGGRKIFGLSRPFLHSAKLEFRHPINRKKLFFKSDLAIDLQKVLDQL